MPHGHCYFWKPEIVWLHVLSDALIVAAYYAIPFMLVYFIRKKKDVPFNWMFQMFGAFIFWCGTTHIMNIFTLWNPVYRLDGIIKAITATVSMATAVLLYPLIPKALALRSPRELEILNEKLESEINVRKVAEKQLEEINHQLEKRVAERTLQVQQKSKELESSNSELEQFAYVASHDLQEPLRMISSYCQLLKEEQRVNLSDETTQYIDFAVDGAQRMKGLIDDLLEFSRIGRRLDEAFEAVDCNDVLRIAIQNLEESINRNSAKIQYEQLPFVMGNKVSIIRLFQNLLSNALKYTKNGEAPQISISVQEQDEHWRFSVSDRGIGIERKYFDRIFMIFQRLHSRTEYAGSGMGLAICKKIVETHQGKIWVDSELGKYTTFYVTLPKFK